MFSTCCVLSKDLELVRRDLKTKFPKWTTVKLSFFLFFSFPFFSSRDLFLFFFTLLSSCFEESRIDLNEINLERSVDG